MLTCFKYRRFALWAKKEGINDTVLLKALREISKGLVDADLGGGLVKKRLPKKGCGKRSGYRSLVALKLENRAIFVYGFAKNQKDNITPHEKAALQKIARIYLEAGKEELEILLARGEIIEVTV